MKLGLQVKLRQTIAPQLIQSLRLLQMPILKLEQLLRQELSTNPLLEEVEALEEPDTSSTEEQSEIDPQLGKIDWNEYFGEESEFRFRGREEKEKQEEKKERPTVVEKNLYEHLTEQLHFNKLTQDEYNIGEYIIGCIDENGYLTCSVEEIIEALKSDPETTRKILKLIQSFDPPGVGARDLRESLLIQLKERGLEQSLAYRIVSQHINELDKKSLSQLAKSLDTEFEEVQKAMDLIRTLSPKPAAGRFVSGALPIIPDLIVEKVGNEYLVFHNDKNIPRLRVNPAYKELLKKNSPTKPEARDYVKGKLEQARWLLNAINHRRSTMVNVMGAIIEEQKDFFESGPEFLKPLIMEAIASKLNMNVATVSRVSNDKYVQTPQGLYEIRYFFNSGMTRDDGQEISKRQIKSILEEIIKEEDLSSPLSDREIYSRLKEKGIGLARRTVTKYREELKILPARFRKRMTSNKSKPEDKTKEEDTVPPENID
ncbi:MAG: RNA polymerase factor sigma-54 [candidate division Zixibacteria bacterium]|nr:RNA polymerase factor sigma-54 [candidate division Zixibacteria bacterium]